MKQKTEWIGLRRYATIIGDVILFNLSVLLAFMFDSVDRFQIEISILISTRQLRSRWVFLRLTFCLGFMFSIIAVFRTFYSIPFLVNF